MFTKMCEHRLCCEFALGMLPCAALFVNCLALYTVLCYAVCSLLLYLLLTWGFSYCYFYYRATNKYLKKLCPGLVFLLLARFACINCIIKTYICLK